VFDVRQKNLSTDGLEFFVALFSVSMATADLLDV
jgi:hypothetical protein